MQIYQKACKGKNKQEINIALKYTSVKDGKAYNNNGLHALHVNTIKDEAGKTIGVIKKMYGHRASVFPCGIKLYYVSCYEKNIPSHTKASILSLKVRQEWYIANLSFATSWDIISLTTPFNNKNMTLRDAIMKKKGQRRSTFL